ncbi:hypothetical protein EJ04DRAFT_393047, partial [Polyplosphaeria fusca]
LFITSITLFRLASTISSMRCLDVVEMPSPVHSILSDELTPMRIDGRFWEENEYKGPPSPERDAAWNALTNHGGGFFSISQETLQAANASEHSIELPDSIGGGYMASLEVTHQLHCVQLIREWSYRDYYRNKSIIFYDSDETLRIHLDHCIDNLRQKLMCDSDTGILTYVWIKNRSSPYADFGVQKKCRNYSQVQEW